MGSTFLAGCAPSLAPAPSSTPTPPTSSHESDTDPAGNEKLTSTLFLYDTIIDITAYTTAETMATLEKELKNYEHFFSHTVEGSDVWRINESKGQPTQVDPMTAEVIARSLPYCDETNGAFNIAIGRITELWDFAEKTIAQPEALKDALKHVDYTKIHVENDTVTLLDPEMKIELGAVAKGYIADKVVEFLHESGCTSAMINLGGNIYAIGTKPNGEPWIVGVQDPQKDGAILATVPAKDESVVTSGLYERSFTKNGIFYHHILDPSTGMPAGSDLIGTTIMGKNSFECDIYSTVTFLLGLEKALAFLELHSDYEGAFVTTAGEYVPTPGFKGEVVE